MKLKKLGKVLSGVFNLSIKENNETFSIIIENFEKHHLYSHLKNYKVDAIYKDKIKVIKQQETFEEKS